MVTAVANHKIEASIVVGPCMEAVKLLSTRSQNIISIQQTVLASVFISTPTDEGSRERDTGAVVLELTRQSTRCKTGARRTTQQHDHAGAPDPQTCTPSHPPIDCLTRLRAPKF
jgi:hypothetical protein